MRAGAAPNPVSVVSARGRRVLLGDAGREQRRRAAEEFRRRQFVQLEGVVDPTPLVPVVDRILQAGRQLETPRIKPLSVSGTQIDSGFRFSRIDWASHPQAAQLRHLFDQEGLTALGESIAEAFRPLVELALDSPARYDRVFLLIYREGDFIGPHGLDSTGRRVNVQIPLVRGCRTAMRVTDGDTLRLAYDAPGSARLLGTGFCHEVLPVLAVDGERPLRVVVSHRFLAEDGR